MTNLRSVPNSIVISQNSFQGAPHLPDKMAISQHHRLFKMCISCNADQRPTISFAPPHSLKVQIVNVNLKESTKLISCS